MCGPHPAEESFCNTVLEGQTGRELDENRAKLRAQNPYSREKGGYWLERALETILVGG